MIVYKENNLSKYVFLNLTLHFGGVLSSLVIGICFKGMTPGRPKNPPGVCPKNGFRAAQLKVVRPPNGSVVC